MDKTSRSFSAVIQELHPELLVPIALFYLILRGLDTIEDDMTIPLEKKEPLLKEFYKIIEKEGWSFSGNGPDERDRELLVQFHYVTEEYRKIKPVYREIINDVADQMGNGMAEYCRRSAEGRSGVESVKDYDLYCYYVAGLVGNGLTRLFVESGLANPALKERKQLQTSMGLFLQKTNIIRDVKEDWDDKRRFWPREIWSKYVDDFGDLFKPEKKEAALNCISEMVLNSLNHADECLFYLAGLREQSVFNFAAIPQAMAIATLALVFRNPQIYKKNIKITKGEACQIMLDSTQNLQKVCEVFRKFVRQIHRKNTPKDPNFLKISVACGKVLSDLHSLRAGITSDRSSNSSSLSSHRKILRRCRGLLRPACLWPRKKTPKWSGNAKKPNGIPVRVDVPSFKPLTLTLRSVYMMIAVMGTITVVTIIMVSLL